MIPMTIEMPYPTIVVAGGKGGVGKTTATANISRCLARRGWRVAALDIDLSGPNLARELGVEVSGCDVDEYHYYPKKVTDESNGQIEVFSMSFLLPPDIALAWSGDMRNDIVHEMMELIEWDSPDILICDSPPGTGDEFTGLYENVRVEGVIVITTGSATSIDDVRRLVSLTKTKRYATEIIGGVLNMGYMEVELPDGTIDQQRVFADYSREEIESILGLPIVATVPFGARLPDAYEPVAERIENAYLIQTAPVEV